jgi:hypothetical protein
VEIAISLGPLETHRPPLCGPVLAYITSNQRAQGQKNSAPPSKTPKP